MGSVQNNKENNDTVLGCGEMLLLYEYTAGLQG